MASPFAKPSENDAPKVLVLVDGEHYPAVTARAVSALAKTENIAGAFFVGGTEKLGRFPLELGVETIVPTGDVEQELGEAIDRLAVTKVIDISDEPVLGYRRRCRMACIALHKGASYEGPDFEFRPPARPEIAKSASLAVIGTGKRSGKTAICATAARLADKDGLRPIVVAMGRGGPEKPQFVGPGQKPTAASLLEMSKRGDHAASDYLEDALVAGVPAVGGWRAGGGLAGATAFSNFDKAIEKAEQQKPGLLLFEGSGAAIPPAAADATVLVVDARIDPEALCGYFGLYRLLLADLVVVTMCEPHLDSSQIDAIEECLSAARINAPVVRCVFRPFPLSDIRGRRVFFATTAAASSIASMTGHLEDKCGASVVAVSRSLSDRSKLAADLNAAPKADVMLCELKAAAVDVAATYAVDHKMNVVFCDNRPCDAEDPARSVNISSALQQAAQLALDRNALGR